MDESEGEHTGFAPTIRKDVMFCSEGEHTGFAPTIRKDVMFCRGIRGLSFFEKKLNSRFKFFR